MFGKQPEFPTPDWSAIVAALRRDEPQGLSELRRWFGNGLRYFLSRQGFAGEAPDLQEGVLLEVGRIVRAGDLPDPEELPRCVRVTAGLMTQSLSDGTRSEEVDKETERRVTAAVKALRQLSPSDRELVAAYLDGASPDEICDSIDSRSRFEIVKARVFQQLQEETSKLAGQGWIGPCSQHLDRNAQQARCAAKTLATDSAGEGTRHPKPIPVGNSSMSARKGTAHDPLGEQ